MRTATFDLPNGILSPGGDLIRSVTIRQLDGKDEDTVRDKKKLREGNVIDKLMRRAIMAFGDFDDRKTIIQLYNSKFLMADLTFLLVKLRIWSIDPVYRFDFTCSNCNKISRQQIDLTLLELTPQPKEYQGLERHSKVIKGDEDEDLLIEFVPLYNRQMKMMGIIKENYGQEKGTRELMLQVKGIGGQPVDKNSLQSLSWRVRNRIREAMDSTIGGIDTELEIECPRCSKVHKATMPVDVRDFFFPTGGSSKTQTALPFRVSGMTSTSWDPNGDGHPTTSEVSPSVSASGTPTSLPTSAATSEPKTES